MSVKESLHKLETNLAALAVSMHCRRDPVDFATQLNKRAREWNINGRRAVGGKR